jgi:hypothetical protein
LLVGGGSGDRVAVALLDAAGNRIATARGENREAMREVVWDLADRKGDLLRIEVVDRELGGWGHINVDDIRCSD